MIPRILVVDDDPGVIDFLRYNLEKNGFLTSVARKGEEVLGKVLSQKPDLVLLDITLPDIDGVEVCRRIRERPELDNTLVVFFTALTGDYAQVASFDVGADDFITKPTNVKVLVSRITSLVKRRKKLASPAPPAPNGLTIDDERRIISVEGQAKFLPRKEYEILQLLVSRPGKVFSRNEIFSQVWGNDIIVSRRTIDVHIRKIRENIGNRYIKTVRGGGYSFQE